jgi:sarcosine oxidase subunit alpha
MTAPTIEIMVDGRSVSTETGATVASAMLNAGVVEFRKSPGRTMRAPLCGMGVCFECRVTIDGVPHQRACLVVARAGMAIQSAKADE